MKSQWQKTFLFGCFALVIFIFIMVSINSRHLRPSADDYCTGFIAQYGLIGAPLHMWSTWSGYFFTMFIENITNGVPLLYLPWSISSSISFILSAIGMGITTVILIPTQQRNLKSAIFVALLMAFLWWTYVWIPVAFLRSGVDLANGLTHWQTLTSGYMLTTQMLLCLWALLWQASKKSFPPFLIVILFTLLGLFFGFSSEPVNLAAISVFGLYLVRWVLFYRKQTISKVQMYWLMFGISTIIAVALAHLSPGNLVRTALIKPDFSFSIERVLYLISWTFPYGFKRWLSSYFDLQGLITFAIVFLIHSLSKSSISAAAQSTYLIRGLQLSGFGLLLFLIARFGQAFSYEGYWHFVSGTVLTVLSIYFIAVYAASTLAPRLNQVSKVAMAIVLLLSLLMATFANYKMVQSIQSRAILWSQGKAPLAGITDIETEWVNNCWLNLQLLRGDKRRIER